MQEPTNLSNEEMLIENELETLYALQDNPSTHGKRGIMVKMLMDQNIPTGAILSGIRSLHGDDLKKIKFGIILAAARRFVQVDDMKPCDDCRMGYVIFRHPEGGDFSLACKCPMGYSKETTQGLKPWKGGDTVMLKSGLAAKVS